MAQKMAYRNPFGLAYLVNKVGHLLSELGFDLQTSDTLLRKIRDHIFWLNSNTKFNTNPTVDDQPYYQNI